MHDSSFSFRRVRRVASFLNCEQAVDQPSAPGRARRITSTAVLSSLSACRLRNGLPIACTERIAA